MTLPAVAAKIRSRRDLSGDPYGNVAANEEGVVSAFEADPDFTLRPRLAHYLAGLSDAAAMERRSGNSVVAQEMAREADTVRRILEGESP